MSISLQKGQKISLIKQGDNSLKKIVVGLGWDQAGKSKNKGIFSFFSGNIDCDASAILLEEGKLVDKKDVISFMNLKHRSGAVVHTGDNLTGEGDGDDEQIIINVDLIPERINKIVFVANIFCARERKQHFGMIKNAFIRVFNAENNVELCKYQLTDEYDGYTAMIFGEIYRYNGEWKFNSIGQGTKADSIEELIKDYR